MTAQAFCHPAVRYGVMIYVTSDKLVESSVVTVSALVPFPQLALTGTPDVHALFASLGRVDLINPPSGGADDWRLMTEAEVAEYRDQEQNG